MKFNVGPIESDPASSDLVDYLRSHYGTLGLEDSELYYDFPIYKDDLGDPVAAKILIASLQYGIIAIQTTNTTSRDDIEAAYFELVDSLSKAISNLFGRLLRHKSLKQSSTSLRFPLTGLIFAPFIDGIDEPDLEFPVFRRTVDLVGILEEHRWLGPDRDVWHETISVIEGAKGLIIPKPREIEDPTGLAKGRVANLVEAAIMSFDERQKASSIIATFDGPQRIRGLAGSGKTVVLALKAAITHLRNPDATIVYTFYTRSLYQQVRRLITRFYRQFDDRDPNWDRILVMHAWGGRTNEGVYYNAAVRHGVNPLTFTDARRLDHLAPFDLACKKLTDDVELEPVYDFMFVDEGQDFPASFIRLCAQIAKNQRVVWAYDDLQTIFQVLSPSPEQVFGVDHQGKPLVELNLDTVLHKCYRNPREALVCAHALGFGIYGERVVQMLENREHWEDIGYSVQSGDFTEGSLIEVERPVEFSLPTISEYYSPEEIVQSFVGESFDDEINYVTSRIAEDIRGGLRPQEILVTVVDDRHAKIYLDRISSDLAGKGIQTNNIHEDSFGIRDFKREDQVTLSTVHKAKGNEAFSVYVVGVDALFSTTAGVRERNMLFTAMTRAKGWVTVTGVGEAAQLCQRELNEALSNFPFMRFRYPGPGELKIMKRDLTDRGRRKLKRERMLDQLLAEMEPEEIERFMRQRSIEKGTTE
jgi:superfamily I DNA and RNA helicase